MEKEKKSGGARPGAGRKAHEVKKELFRVTPEEKQIILDLRQKAKSKPPKVEKSTKINNSGKWLKERLSEIK